MRSSSARAELNVPQPSTSRLAQRSIMRQRERDILLRNFHLHIVSRATHLRIERSSRLETHQPRMEP